MKERPYVLFDLGGTLVDLRGIVASMSEGLRAIRVRQPVPLALEWALETARRLPTAQGSRFRAERELTADVLTTLLVKRGHPVPREESDRLVAEAWGQFVTMCALQPDVTVEWLAGFRREVAGLGLVTDGDTAAIDGILARLHLSEHFDSVIASQAVRSYKPDARIYRAALRALDAPPDKTLFVSDATLDLKGAADVGVAGAWIPRGMLPDLSTKPEGTIVLANLRDVEQAVNRFAATGRFS